MATYYVRGDGSNSNTGTGSGTGQAWQTITKALGATGISSGDTVYIAPGTYRELVTVAMTSAVAETFVLGDPSASQFSDVTPGDVILSAYTTNDKTVPSTTSPVLALAGRDFLTFRDLVLVGANIANGCVDATTATSTNVKLTRCLLISNRASNALAITALVDAASTWTVEQCVIYTPGTGITVTLPTSTTADYDAEVVIRNCLFCAWAQGASTGVFVLSSGANSFKGGGVKVYNCTFIMAGTAMNTQGTSIATSAGNQCEFYNCLAWGETTLTAGASGQIVEDYNYLLGGTPRTNVSSGASSQVAGANRQPPYALLLHFGQERLFGQNLRPFLSPMVNSPILGFGNDGSIGVQTEDAFGVPRPAGPARTWASALKAIGYSERGDTGQRESTTVRSGSYALKLLGPSVQDVTIPVAAASTTVTVYGRFDSAYGSGTKPRLRVLANAECGVSEATDTMTGSADAWEELSLNFTPTRAGVVTVRFMSDGDGDGSAFFDDFAVA